MQYVMRDRTRGTDLTQTFANRLFSQWQTCAQTQETVASQYVQPIEGKFEFFSDVVTPGFHNRSQKGDVIMSPMWKRVQEIERTRGNGTRAIWGGAGINCSGTIRKQILREEYWRGEVHYGLASGNPSVHPMTIGSLDLIDPSDIEALLIEHETRVTSERSRSDHDLWEALAEVDKSLSLLSGILRSLSGALTSRTLMGKAKELGKAYLMFRYGVQPLMKDAVGVIEGLEKKVGKIRKTTRSNGHIQQDSSDAKTYSGAGWYTSTILAHYEDSILVRVMSLDELNASSAFNVGFSLKSLITLPWELIPYSFVVDWFANIGDFLGSFAPNLNGRQLGSCIVVERKQSVELSQGATSGINGWTMTAGGSGAFKNTITTRQRHVRPLRSGLVVKSDFRFHNLTRCLDALSLIVVRLR